ncbi:MAG: hypothetical protein Q8J89_10400 [Caulobacter sp.]|uniref:hypothetical protein n=1 Tax=Phenylobacterium sp. TaxID=1871053 RepID=UPI0027221348|nr:hypothetical protein [Phenylobacterium sp.]MDO8902083.1 hypothetical protein [Phenylobacterium sp.]MDP2260113.1 hypothetical protein [Caulobacter sp.]
MSAILYPVAADADAALTAPLGRAAREREARALAGGEAVTFVTRAVGPDFASREAALDLYAGKVEDDRPGRLVSLPPEDRYCRLAELAAQVGGRRPVPEAAKPVLKDGRRWPAPPASPVATVWRLQVSFWRVGASAETPLDGPQARRVRRAGAEADRETLNALTRQPLRALRPQQPLDIGLFEVRPPEAPDTVIADE